MSEIKVVSKTDKDVSVDINPDSWYAIEKHDDHNNLIWNGEGWKTNNQFLIRYVPSLKTMYYRSWKPFSISATQLSPFKVKFEGNFKHSKFEANDMLAVRAPYDNANQKNSFFI